MRQAVVETEVSPWWFVAHLRSRDHSPVSRDGGEKHRGHLRHSCVRWEVETYYSGGGDGGGGGGDGDGGGGGSGGGGGGTRRCQYVELKQTREGGCSGLSEKILFCGISFW